jgi:hypothetical protein
MDAQAVARLAVKNERQMMLQELEQYRLSPIEAKAVLQRLDQYLEEQQSDRLAEGQILYPAVAFSEPAGKPLAQCQLIRVKLTLDAPEDLAYLQKGGGGVPALRRARLFRMAFEAVQQGARLTQDDFVRLLGVDPRTIRRIIRAYCQEGVYIPTRGYSKDIGRGTSHKAIAVRMFLEYATYTAMEQKTGDTAACLMRYLKDFAAVVKAADLGIPEHELPVVTGLSAGLVKEYLALCQTYNTPQHQGILERIRHPLVTGPEAGDGGKGGRR